MKRPVCYADPATGLLHRWPVSLVESKALRLPRWTDLAGCRECEATGSPPGPKSRYVEGLQCVGCLHVLAPKILRSWAAGAPGAPPIVAMTAEAALLAGVDYFVGGDAEQGLLCRNGPHLRLTHVVTGRCVTCQAARRRPVAIKPPPGPRKAARRAGHRYYTPEAACPDCGQCAPRDVVTNKCRGCVRRPVVGEEDARTTDVSRMIADAPDLVISRGDARGLGMTVYRTGAPCLNGHTGYRYTSTGACIACLRARPRPLKA